MGLFDFLKESISKVTGQSSIPASQSCGHSYTVGNNVTVPPSLPLLQSFDNITFNFENAETFSIGSKVFFMPNPTKEDNCGVAVFCEGSCIGYLPYGRTKVYVSNGLKNPQCKIIGEITAVKKVKATVRIEWYEDMIVLCSPKGKCYHSQSCPSLPSDCVNITISNAEKSGLTPCQKCGGELISDYIERRYYCTK